MTGAHPLGKWNTNTKGYPRFYSGPYRNKYVHRVIFERVAGRAIKPGFHIAHANFDKLDFSPSNLIECPPEFNPAPEIRDPYTGQYLSRDYYERRYAA